MTEDGTTELKRDVSDGITKTVVAFANTAGGTIFVGIDDEGTVVGLPDVDKALLRVGSMIRDAIRPEGVYVRQGASSAPASEEAIRRMIRDTDGDQYEAVRSLNQDLTFRSAEAEFARRDVPLAQAQMRTLGMMEENGIYTNLGLLLSDQCPHSIKAAVFEGGDKEVFRDRREFTGSLLAQAGEAYDFLDRHNRVRAQIRGLSRVESSDYPPEALREALLNALVHREYAFAASTLISVFDDRIELVSIGGLARGLTERDILLGISLSRNPNLANVFYRLRLIEAYGTGIPRMMHSYQDAAARPAIEISDNAFKVVLPNRNAAPAAKARPKEPLGEREGVVLALFDGRESIVRRDVEDALGVSQGTATRLIAAMVRRRLIEAIGQGKNRRYIPAKDS